MSRQELKGHIGLDLLPVERDRVERKVVEHGFLSLGDLATREPHVAYGLLREELSNRSPRLAAAALPYPAAMPQDTEVVVRVVRPDLPPVEWGGAQWPQRDRVLTFNLSLQPPQPPAA